MPCAKGESIERRVPGGRSLWLRLAWLEHLVGREEAARIYLGCGGGRVFIEQPPVPKHYHVRFDPRRRTAGFHA